MSKQSQATPESKAKAQEPKQKHDSSLNIYQRMIEVQKLATTVVKSATVKMSENDKGYKAVTHDEVAATLHLPLAECGVFMLPEIVSYKTENFDKTNQWGKVVTWYRTDLEILVKWVNVDKPDEYISSRGAAFALDTSDKSFAKAYSLALKIVLLKVHLLESRDGEENRPFDEAHGGDKAGKGEGGNRNSRPKNENQTPPAEKSKPQTENTPVAPKDVVMPFGQASGKKLGDLDTATLEKAKAWLKSEMAKDPKPANMKQIAFIYSQVKAVLIDRNPPPPPPTDEPKAPEDTPDPFPPDDVQISPEETSQERQTKKNQPDPQDYVIPEAKGLDAISELFGKPLKSIGERDLRNALKVIDGVMQKGPPPPNLGELFGIRTAIAAFFNSMGLKA